MTLKKTLGGTPFDLLEAITEGFGGMVEETGNAFANMAQDDPAPRTTMPQFRRFSSWPSVVPSEESARKTYLGIIVKKTVPFYVNTNIGLA